MFYQDIETYLGTLVLSPGSVAAARRTLLRPLVEFIHTQNLNDGNANLNFICTHNSRRSQLCQVWATVAAHRCGIGNVRAFSGGTEVTAFNPRAVAALERSGFRVEKNGEGNARYQVFFSEKAPPIECFSKLYDDPQNSAEPYAAVMTCTDADEKCPAVIGARRISLPYEDPKIGDGTSDEANLYDVRCRQIALEMLWVMEQVRSLR